MITVLVTIYLFYTGYSYYNLPIEERFYHPNHDWFKPSGIYGHGIGILGTLMILFGVVIYIARKRYNFMVRILRLKYLLEFHIFLCTLGPILILFHTAFKFGGIVSIAFWSMVAVVLSGVIGRFIYIQIPHSIEGRALSLQEVQDMKSGIGEQLKEKFEFDEGLSLQIAGLTSGVGGKPSLRGISRTLKSRNIPRKDRKDILSLLKNEISLSRKIARLQQMQKLFKYWHVAHLPFALIMLIIVVIHVGVTLAFGYKWIF